MRLLEPVQIGDFALRNRMVMAPMTRSRVSIEGIVGDSTVLYYTKRSTAGLIITEAINISEQGIGSPLTPDQYPQYPADPIETFGSISKHPVIANYGYNREIGEAELQKGIAKLIAYGQLFLANPDLPVRFELNAELNQADRSTMFGGQDQGYIDYPFLNK